MGGPSSLVFDEGGSGFVRSAEKGMRGSFGLERERGGFGLERERKEIDDAGGFDVKERNDGVVGESMERGKVEEE